VSRIDPSLRGLGVRAAAGALPSFSIDHKRLTSRTLRNFSCEPVGPDEEDVMGRIRSHRGTVISTLTTTCEEPEKGTAAAAEAEATFPLPRGLTRISHETIEWRCLLLIRNLCLLTPAARQK
jgi:hypothetical protein